MNSGNGMFSVVDERQASRIRLVIGLGFLLLAVSDLLVGPADMSSGRWAWLHAWIVGLLGQYGWATLNAVLGVAFISWGWISARSKKSDRR